MNDAKLRTVTGGIRYCCEKFWALFPDVKIVFVIPIHNGKLGNNWQRAFDVRKAIIDAASILSVETIDQMTEVGINPYYELTGMAGIADRHKYLADGTHPNAAGGKIQCEYLVRKFKQILV